MVASTWMQDRGRQEEIVAYKEFDHSDMAATDGGTVATGTYEAVHLPQNAIVTGGYAVISEAFPASVTIDIGDGVDDDRYVKNDADAGGTVVYPVIGSLAEQTLGDVMYLCPTGYKYTAADTIDLKIGGAAPTASGKIKLVVKYVVEDREAFGQG